MFLLSFGIIFGILNILNVSSVLGIFLYIGILAIEAIGVKLILDRYWNWRAAIKNRRMVVKTKLIDSDE